MAADRGRSSPAVCGLSRSSSFGFDYPKSWKNCWGGLKCFTPRRRVKYHSTETSLAPQSISGEISAVKGSLASDTLNPVTLLPPVMGAPPSSPVSFVETPGRCTLSQLSTANLLSLFPENSDRVDNHHGLPFNVCKTDVHVGRFILDDALVTPPLNSTLTTAAVTPLSTAPFTPPPELAHLTTPTSPEVPNTQMLDYSFAEFRSSLSKKVEHLSLQSFPSAHLQLTHRLYPCSPIGQLITYNSEASSPEAVSPMPERVPLEKETSCTNVVNNCFLSVLEDASLEESGRETSESVCDKPVNQKEGPQKGHTVVADTFKHEDTKSSHFAADSCSYNDRHKTQDTEGCCSRCGELSAKCRDLSEALEQTRKKLMLVETKVDSIDVRERRFKQLIQWMQLSAKLRQENILQLSEELSWQGAAFEDLQDSYLAEAGISVPNVGKDVR